jgi:alpha-2-macroglobulin
MTQEPSDTQSRAGDQPATDTAEGTAPPAGSGPQLPPWLFPILGGGAILVALVVTILVVQLRGGEESADLPPVAVAPLGDTVPRLGPLVISFRDAPSTQDHTQLISFSPAAEATYVWADDRTLLMQPEFPGLLRGGTYELRVHARPAGLEQDYVANFTVEGRLTVDAVIPGPDDAEVPVEAHVYVQFSRSVAPLTMLQAQRTGAVVEFDPPLTGQGEWLNTSLYRLIPDNLQPSTTYRARVPAGLTSEDDGVLEADFEWTFVTIGPALATSQPADGSLFVPRASEVVLTFNQPMDRASTEAGVRLQREDGATVATSAAWSEDGATLTLTPVEPLTLSATYRAIVEAGISGVTGGATSAERVIRFSTSDPPALTNSHPRDGDQQASRWGIELFFNNPMDIDSIEERLTVSGIASERLQLFSWDDRTVFIQVQLEPSTDYTVSIADGATDREGLALGPVSLSFRTGRLESSVGYAVPWGSGATYSSAAEQLLYFYVTNRESVDFELYRLPEQQAWALQEGGQMLPDRVRTAGELVRAWSVNTEGSENRQLLGSTSLGDGEPLPKGYYYVHTPGDQMWGPMSLFFVVTDTTMVTKLAQDELLIWTLDSETGAPLANAEVRVNGPGVSNVAARTDANGLAAVAVPERRDLSPNIVRHYRVTTTDAGRLGVTRTDWQQGSALWDLGIPIEWWPRQFVAHLYTDRPIYRTGETVYYKAVVRIDDDADYRVPEPGDTGLRLTVTDARGTQLESIPVVTNDFGTIAGEFVIPEGNPTGFYTIAIEETGTWGGWVTGSSFTVAEFRRPEFQVEVDAGGRDFINGETMNVEATASFFFGGPLADASVTWSALAFPSWVTFEGYERYSFTDFDAFQPSVFEDPLRATGEARTDANGVARFPVAASLRANESTLDYTVSVTVQDQSGQAIASSASAKVHPAQFYAGVSSSSYVATEGEATTIDLVTVDTSGQPAGNRPVTVSVYHREWVTVKEESDVGGRRYRSEPNDTLLTTLTATTGADGAASVTYTPESPGTLRVVAQTTDPTGRTARAAHYIWVSGTQNVAWYVPNSDVIELIADREEYEVGDTAEVLVPAPFPGAVALVTVERNRVLERSVHTFESNSEVLRIPIEDRNVPTVYVGVVLYRAPTAEDPVARYHVGYAQLNVSTESRELDVSITSDVERAKPGDTVTYEVQVRDRRGQPVEAELSVAVVDLAVLSLASETGPDGLGAFWFQRGLGVETASSASVSINRSNDVLPEPDLGGKGGGGDEEDARGDFRNTAHWEGQLRTDANGRASVTVRMPDNLTTWRTQVRAVSGETQVGESVHELLVTQPLLIRPALPRFLRVGDEPEIRVLIRNGTERVENVEVALEATGVNVSGALTQTRSIAPGVTEAFAWPATVSQHGEATFTFRASGGTERDAVTLTIPVHRDVTTETVATGGTVAGTSAVETVYLPPFAITDDGTLDVALQGSLVGALTSELVELRPLQFESAVRIASRVAATINARRAEGATGDALTAGLSSDLSQLRSLQRFDGGWGWCRDCQTNITVTGWVLLALGEARAAGVSDVEGMAGRAGMLVREHVNRAADVERPVDPNERAFLLYAMQHSTGASWVENSLRGVVEQDRARLTAWGRSYAILGLLGAGAATDDPLVRTLMADLNASMLPSATGNHWEDPPVYGSIETNTSTTALVLQALVAADPRHPLIEETARWLVNARTAQRWQTVVERAHAIAGLGRYAELTGERQGDYEYRVTMDDGPLMSGRFQPAAGENFDSATVALRDLAVGQVHRLLLSRQTTTGRLYYALNLRYVTPAGEVEALNRGLAVSRQYSLLGDPDRPVSEARLGEVVRVTLTIVAPADRKFVQVEDFLPAGLEAIDTRLETVPEELRLILAQEQREALAHGEAPGFAAPWFRWYWSPWDETNVRDDRFTLFATELPRGVHEYVYYARATTPGMFFVAPVHAEESAMPDVFGRSDSTQFRVRN